MRTGRCRRRGISDAAIDRDRAVPASGRHRVAPRHGAPPVADGWSLLTADAGASNRAVRRVRRQRVAVLGVSTPPPTSSTAEPPAEGYLVRVPRVEGVRHDVARQGERTMRRARWCPGSPWPLPRCPTTGLDGSSPRCRDVAGRLPTRAAAAPPVLAHPGSCPSDRVAWLVGGGIDADHGTTLRTEAIAPSSRRGRNDRAARGIWALSRLPRTATWGPRGKGRGRRSGGGGLVEWPPGGAGFGRLLAAPAPSVDGGSAVAERLCWAPATGRRHPARARGRRSADPGGGAGRWAVARDRSVRWSVRSERPQRCTPVRGCAGYAGLPPVSGLRPTLDPG